MLVGLARTMDERSIICFQEKRNEGVVIYAVIYQQCDNSLVGRTLAAFLKKVMLVSFMEIGPEAEYKENRIVCHGFGDMVARFVKKMKKDKRGDFYLSPATANQRESYVYYVTKMDEGVRVQVKGQKNRRALEVERENLTTEMSIKEFVDMCEKGILMGRREASKGYLKIIGI